MCLVNGIFLAKYYHRKEDVKTKKVTYLPVRDYVTNDGIPIWADCFYAPSSAPRDPDKNLKNQQEQEREEMKRQEEEEIKQHEAIIAAIAK